MVNDPQNLLSGPISSPPPSNPLPPPANGNQGVEQQSLNGGGVDNKQQVSNFMNALNRTGQGGNNQMMQGSPPPQQQGQQVLQQPIQMPEQVSTQNTLQPGSFAPAPQNMQGTNTPGYYQQGQQGAMGNQSDGKATVQYQGSTPGQNTGPVINPSQFYGSTINQQGNTGSQTLAALHPQQTIGQVSNPATQAALSTPPAQSSTNSFVPPGTIDPQQNSPAQQPLVPYQQTISQSPFSAALAYSDENLKTNIEPGKRDITEFLNTIKAHNYEYKDQRDGVGTFTTPMAQELEKTELGKQAVIETPRGKMVDYGRLGGVNLAAVSVVHREQQRLQAQFDELKAAINKKGYK